VIVVDGEQIVFDGQVLRAVAEAKGKTDSEEGKKGNSNKVEEAVLGGTITGRIQF
jgi:hypothetical protein